MNDSRQGQRIHTWDILINYYKCPFCLTILENREHFQEKKDFYYKDFLCTECGKQFTVTKEKRRGYKPFFGQPKP